LKQKQDICNTPIDDYTISSTKVFFLLGPI